MAGELDGGDASVPPIRTNRRIQIWSTEEPGQPQGIDPPSRCGSHRRFTRVKRVTYIVGMTLAVILEMVPYCLSWCEWDAIHGSLRPFLLLSKGKAIQTGGPCPVVQPATAFAHRLDLVHQVHQVHLPGSGWLRQALWGAGEDLQPCSGKCLLA